MSRWDDRDVDVWATMSTMDQIAAAVARLTGKIVTSCALVPIFSDRPWPAKLFLDTADGHRITIDVGSISIVSPDGGYIKGMDDRHAQAQTLAMAQ